jgi:LysM repeat protein
VHLRAQSQLLYNRGLELARVGDLKSAMLALQEGVTADPTNIAALNVLAKVYAQQGLDEQARETWQAVLKSAPDDTSAKAGIAQSDARQQAIQQSAAAAAGAIKQRKWLQLGLAFLAGLVLLAIVVWLALPTLSAPNVNAATTAVAVAAQATNDAFTANARTEKTSIALSTNQTSEAIVHAADQTVTAVALEASQHPVIVTATPSPVTPPATAAPPTQTPLPEPTVNLTQRVQDVLKARTELAGIAIEVAQRGDVVQLSGQVPALLLRYLIVKTASDVQGVEGIDAKNLVLTNTYVVQEGDSFSSIAQRLYNSRRFALAIAVANNLKLTDTILPGQTLVLPNP